MARAHRRPVWAEIDRAALRANAATMRRLVAPAELCAVVKADAYGHGALDAAHAFLDGGAGSLAVALVEEGIELRRAGIEAPILLLSEPAVGGMDEAVIHHLTPTVYTPEGLHALGRAARRLGDGRHRVPVHVKVDTGMHRVGATPESGESLVTEVENDPGLRLAGLWTHLAVADEPEDPYTDRQLELFDAFLATWGGSRSSAGQAGAPEEVIVHAANSAAALSRVDARYSMVRCGLALYGYPPVEPASGDDAHFEPVMSLKARVAFVKELEAAERLSYGLAYTVEKRSSVATVPLGYADGVPRRFGISGGRALIEGRAFPVAGHVTMDQLMIDCGPGRTVVAGEEVVLLGRQGDAEITARDWAGWLGVIPYEVLCGIGSRVPRVAV